MNEDPTAVGGPREVAHSALKGAIAAMAMTGMRQFTVRVGLVKRAPPQAIFREKAREVLRLVPRKRRRVLEELFHWGYGAGGGAVYGALPDTIQQRAWSGPVYGLAVWTSFELGLAPLLGLSHAKKPRVIERIALAVDHLLYGFVLSETRRRPKE